MLRCRSGHLLHRPSPGQLGNVELSHYVKSYGILEKLKLKNNIVSPNVCTVFKMFTWKLAIPIFSLRTQSLVRLQVTHTGKWHDFEKIALLLNSKWDLYCFAQSFLLFLYSSSLCLWVWWTHIACGRPLLTVWATQSHCVWKAEPPCLLWVQAFYCFPKSG